MWHHHNGHVHVPYTVKHLKSEHSEIRIPLIRTVPKVALVYEATYEMSPVPMVFTIVFHCTVHVQYVVLL